MSVRGSIRCIWLRSARSGIELADIARCSRVDAGANLDPVDDKVNHRLHAHRLDDIEPGGERDEPRGILAAARLGDVLRAQPEQHLVADAPAVARLARRRHREGEPVGQAHGQPAAVLHDTARQQIHRRRADEGGDKPGLWRMVDLMRRADLVDAPGVHDDDAIGQGHRFDLVVGDVNRGRRHLLMDLFDLGAHLHAQFGVEVGERLVEQKYLRVADDGAAHGDTLALAARQLLWPALEQLGDVENAGGGLHPLVDLGLREPFQAQPERHVFEHRHMRVERIVLEHHGDVPVLWRHVVDQLVADIDLARGGFLEAGDHAQGRALAAARRPDQHDELAIGDVDVDPPHRRGLVKGLDDVAKRDLRHLAFLTVVPAVGPAMCRCGAVHPRRYPLRDHSVGGIVGCPDFWSGAARMFRCRSEGRILKNGSAKCNFSIAVRMRRGSRRPPSPRPCRRR